MRDWCPKKLNDTIRTWTILRYTLEWTWLSTRSHLWIYERIVIVTNRSNINVDESPFIIQIFLLIVNDGLSVLIVEWSWISSRFDRLSSDLPTKKPSIFRIRYEWAFSLYFIVVISIQTGSIRNAIHLQWIKYERY